MTDYNTNLHKRDANYTPLSPLSFLRRTAETFPNRVAIINGELHRNWKETYSRCVQLASALSGVGIGKNDTVSVIAPNIPELFEAHFGVPMCGGVLNALNTRLDAEGIAFILDHSETKVLIADREFSPLVSEALAKVKNKPLLIDIDSLDANGGECIGESTYEEFIANAAPDFKWHLPDDEWDALSLNYTSGTTGDPKGVVYSHRGAYLNSLGNITAWAMPHHPTYLWTLPMFHCNGWCFPWTITVMAGTHICTRSVDAELIYSLLAEHDVTHLCGAPIVMGMIVNAKQSQQRPLQRRVKMMTAGAAPPSPLLLAMDAAGFDVTHVYGLTEVYGPVVVCAWQDKWDELSADSQAELKSRQGVKYSVQEDFYVADPETMQPTPADGETMGELMMRGNVVMKGYLKNTQRTEEAFAGGAFHTGDLGVLHPDGYVEIKDRSKDIVISGGENISTIEVEDAIYHHPAVLEAAVVAQDDEKWGETPLAFVTIKPGEVLDAHELINFCRSRLAHFKCPKSVVFTELPKTSTGKIQKFKLRELAKKLNA